MKCNNNTTTTNNNNNNNNIDIFPPFFLWLMKKASRHCLSIWLRKCAECWVLC
jgi:hypothetical protein